MNILSHIDDWGLWLTLVGGGLVTLFTWFKVLKPRIQGVSREVRSARDSLLGRDAILDTITGKELAPALPGIGQRMDTIETALTQLVDVHVRLNSHEKRLLDLERMDMERAIARTETIEMYRTMDTALRSQPADEDGKEKR